MSDEAFHAYYENAVQSYAQEHIKAGTFQPDTALAQSRKEFEDLLPNGVSSPNQYLYSIHDTDTNEIVGMIWFAHRLEFNPPHAFIYDFNVYDRFQRKGYGAKALLALEDEVRKIGDDEVELHVFGHNTAARALYEKVGYEATNIRMVKKV